jgi:hypothetical protein
MEHLDFGVRNTLLYYKDLKTTLDLTPGMGANEQAVARLLASDRVPLSEIFDSDDDALRGAAKRVRSISYRARRDADKGSPGTLCVAWGLASWENGRPAVPAAPIVLRQASVGRYAGTAEDFDLGVSGPWNLNVTLLRLLEIDFGVDVERESLRDLVEELSVDGNPQPLFERVAKIAVDVPGFTIARRVVMAPVPRIAMVVQYDSGPSAPPAPIPIDSSRQRRLAPDAALADPVLDDTVSAAAYPDAAIATPTNDAVLSDAPVGLVPDEVAPSNGAEPVVTEAIVTEAAAVDTVVADAPVAAFVDAALVAAPASTTNGHGAGVQDNEPQGTADTVELFRTGVLNPKKMVDGSLERRIIERFGPDVIIADITATLRQDSWPEALVEHADSGLRVRDRTALLQRWYDASTHRPQPSGWDATHFALWGLAAAPTAGTPAIRSVARWSERRHHPILMAWQEVAERRAAGHGQGRHTRRKKVSLPRRRATVPRGIDEALWGLPVDLLVEWTAWVFRLWPGAPMEFVLPVGTPELVSAWYERARPVAELAIKTWVPFAEVDSALGKSAHRWVKQLTSACGGGGAPLATWFERSMAVATEAVALRLGDPGAAPRRTGRRAVPHAV